MAASIPILRALSKGGFRRPVVLGYGTGYPTSMTTVVETGLRSHRSSHPRPPAAAAALPVPRPPVPPPPSRQPGQQRRNRPESLDEMLTAVGTEAGGYKSDDELSDADGASIEMTNYGNRPQSPVDFTRPNIAPLRIQR